MNNESSESMKEMGEVTLIGPSQSELERLVCG